MPMREYWVYHKRDGVVVLVAVAVGLAVTACGAGQTKTGTVYGTVFGSGGLNEPVGKPIKRLRVEDVTVIATRQGPAVKFKAVSSGDGSFSLTVPPGTYTVKAAGCTAEPPTVRVEPGAKVKSDMDCELA
jgi:hypothetical protein